LNPFRGLIFIAANAQSLPERLAAGLFRAEITAHAGVEERGAAPMRLFFFLVY